MYKCNNCGKIFEEPEIIKTTYEHYYGVSNLLESRTDLSYEACPYCTDESFDEVHDYNVRVLKIYKENDIIKFQFEITDKYDDDLYVKDEEVYDEKDIPSELVLKEIIESDIDYYLP